MSAKNKIPAGFTFIEGRSAERAQELLEAAEAAGKPGEVFTTSFGYLVPDGVLDREDTAAEDDGADAEAKAAEAKAEADAAAKAEADAAAKAEADAAAQAEADAAAQAEADAAAQAEADAAAQAEADAQADADADAEKAEQFDPTEANVEEVLEYLKGADDDEIARVLAAEKAGKNRTTIIREYEEGAK